MNQKEFTLKNVIDLMESQGFHVREGREIEKTEAVDPFGGDSKQPERKIEAIRIEIAPKAKG